MRWSRAWWCAGALALAACGGDDVTHPQLSVEIVTPAGEDPLVGADRLRLRVQQGDGEPIEIDQALGDDGFDVAVPLGDALSEVRVAVALEGPGGLRVGAPPPFAPVELYAGPARIPVAAPDTCSLLAGVELGRGRRGVGLAPQGTFALAIGGVSAEGASPAAEFLDLLALGHGALGDLSRALGRTEVAAIHPGLTVVLPEEAPALRYDIRSAAMAELPADLHEGAGFASSALSLPGGGAVVVGGGSDRVTWIAFDGSTRATSLLVPRSDPALAAVDGAVLVLGGTAAEPWAERITRDAAVGGALVGAPADLPGAGLLVVSDPPTARALVIGGLDPAGAPRTATVLMDCAGSCTFAEGPAWPDARPGAVAVSLPGGGGLVIGGDGPDARVDRITFEPGGARLEAMGPLAVARAEPGVLVLPTGPVLVVGGLGEAGPRADAELCLPRAADLGL